MNTALNLPKTILCIDDDTDDLQMLQEAIHTIDPRCTIIEAYDGIDGLDLLYRMKEQGHLPSLIVLDINMPKLDGKQTFIKIQADQHLAAIPVVVFSTSSSALDKMFFQSKGTAFITKPVLFEQLVEAATTLLRYCS